MVIGYLRVSTGKQHPANQKEEISRFAEKGDPLIVTEISRLSRTLTEIMSIMGKCLEKGIILHTTKEGYTFDDTINSKVLCFAFGYLESGKSIGEICRTFGVSRDTFHKFRKKEPEIDGCTNARPIPH